MSEPEWHNFYDAKVPGRINDPEYNIVEIINRYAELTPRKVAFICYGRKMTYGQLADDICNFASSLISLGIRKGDRTCFLLPNLLQFPVVHLAILKIGAISVPLNPLLTKYEIEKYIKLCQARILITIDTCYEKVKEIRETTSIEKVILTQITDYFSILKKQAYRFKYGKAEDVVIGNEFYSFTELIKKANKDVQFPDLSMNDDAVLLPTGGRTGTIKLATLSHGNLMSNSEQVRTWNLHFERNKGTMLGALPFFHSFGITLCLHYCLLSQIRLVLLPKFSATDAIHAIKKYKVNYFPGVPAMFCGVKHANRKDLDSLDFCISGGCKLDKELQKQFEETKGIRIIESYGLTEASPAAISNPMAGLSKPESIGIPLPSTYAKVVDPLTREELQDGEEGELVIKGPQVMKGYWNNPEETESIIRNGWLYTGDLAKIEKNYFYITGRIKNLIIYGGFNVFPSEVENVLLKHPKIKRAVVSGIPDKKYGELVKASVVLTQGAEMNMMELKDFCKNYLVWYKIPRKLELLSAISNREKSIEVSAV